MLKVEILSHTPNPEEVVASAAKLCYSPVGIDEIIEKQDESNIEKFINNLANIKHYSPFEHASFTFAIEGVSRSLTHQLVRHRIASYSQQSQRYVKESKFEYIVPPAIENSPVAKAIFTKQMELAQEAYDNLVVELMIDKIFNHEKYESWYEKIVEFETKEDNYDVRNVYDNIINPVAKNYNSKLQYLDLFKKHFKTEYSKLEKETIEDARYVFPNATETKIVVTMNARTLLHFFQLRSCSRAQWEIRDLSDKMLTEVYKIAPAIFGKAGPACTWGKCDQGNMSCGVPRSFDELMDN